MPGWCYRWGILFNAGVLVEELKRTRAGGFTHDFGRDLIPYLQQHYPIFAYNFALNRVPGANPEEFGYWRDVGTIDAYFEANMDLRMVKPVFNLYNFKWPLRTCTDPYPPAKFVFNEPGRRGEAIDSIVSEGCIISGGRVQKSILSPHTFVHSHSEVDECILFNGVHIGRGAKVRRAIIDKHVRIPEGAVIGHDLEADRKRYEVSPGGIVVIPKESAEAIYRRHHEKTRGERRW